MNEIGLIVALDRNFAIGRDGKMPWHLPDDLKRFKTLTLGKPVLMGRKTALAIGRDLPGRVNLVMTRGNQPPYALALPRATRMHLTWVDTEVAGADAFFPRFDPREWKEVSRIEHAADARHEHAFAFVDYERQL